MSNKNKTRINVVYSTNPNFNYESESGNSQETLIPEKQHLKIWFEKSGRAGKPVTIIRGFIGKEEDLENLAKQIKTKCGTGGSVKEGEVIIQGDKRDKIVEILTASKYNCKKAGG